MAKREKRKRAIIGQKTEDEEEEEREINTSGCRIFVLQTGATVLGSKTVFSGYYCKNHIDPAGLPFGCQVSSSDGRK